MIELVTNLPAVGNDQIRRLRRNEYDRLVDAGAFAHEHVELIRGVIVRMPPPQGPPHASPIELLNELLVLRLHGRARIRVQLPLIASDESEPEPDVAVVGMERHDGDHPSSAHLVIEVARTSLTYDRETKCPIYAEMGVPECWVVDVVGRVVEVYTQPSGGAYATVRVCRGGDTITLTAFPNVTVGVLEFLP